MIWLKSAWILALAAFWAVAVNHCRLEAISELDFLTCDTAAEETRDSRHQHQPKDCEGDGCAVVENGFYKASETYVAVGQPQRVLDPFAIQPSPASPRLRPSARALATGSLPCQLAATWQFTSRAASLPRAPARAS